MSNVINLNQVVVRNKYGALLAGIHARLAEVAATFTGQELDSFKFVRERGRGRLPDVTAFRYAEAQAQKFQAQFNSVDWNPQSDDVYWLKLGIEVLSATLQGANAVRTSQGAQQVALAA